VVNFFNVLRNKTDELIRRLDLTPFAREAWRNAYEPTEDPIERARRFYVRSWQAYGSSGLRKNETGWRAEKTTERGKRIIDNWNDTEHLYAIAERFGEVQIDCKDALDCIQFYDGSATLFYLDPPYLASTRERVRGYAHEMSGVDSHDALTDLLLSIEGMAAVSGYLSPEYKQWLEPRGWKRVEKTSRTMEGSTQRTECLWLSPTLQERRGNDLFLGTTASYA
jgi:DNA adenine methylase